MAKRETKAEKLKGARITRLYGSVAHGVSIPMLDIPKVYKIAETACDAGDSDDQIAEKIREAVQKIRTN